MEPSVSPDLPIRWHSIGSPYGCLCIGQKDPAPWAQTPMPHHPVEAHFRNGSFNEFYGIEEELDVFLEEYG